MGQPVLDLLRLILPLALENMSVQSPFVHDLLPASGEAVHRPSGWNLYSPGPTAWDWSLRDANGTTWRWEVPQGTWDTWLWGADRDKSNHGGGFRLVQSDGEAWAELSWERADADSARWFCRMREPDQSRGETARSVQDLPAEPWTIRSGDHSWGLVRRRGAPWSFCADELCVALDAASCDRGLHAARLGEEGIDSVEWAAPGGDYRVVNVRLRRSEPASGGFFSDMMDAVVQFFRQLFGGETSGRSGEGSSNSVMRLISAIIGLFASEDSAAEGAAARNQTQLAEELLRLRAAEV
ncbi:uncharacterized protein LOC134530110 [Bacillus rossius redtenbacheri]|uniref:uncharacterized protein LOC134530110 n=1 Tax=Bacillus rossius redtenbacheri TaxID=93214 RepID=UPI002FDDA2BF